MLIFLIEKHPHGSREFVLSCKQLDVKQTPGGEGRKRFSLALSGGGIRAAAFQ